MIAYKQEYWWEKKNFVIFNANSLREVFSLFQKKRKKNFICEYKYSDYAAEYEESQPI